MAPTGPPDLPPHLPRPFDAHGSSFFEVMRREAPEALPRLPEGELPANLREQLTDGTTVLALTYREGVTIVGDRRATAGSLISKQDMRKVFQADHHSAVAISGVAGPAMGLAQIFATELEHYEKVEGDALSLEGKSNKLAHMVRANLPLAMQGLVVVPLFAGVDAWQTEGPVQRSIYEYDPIGGRYRATDYAAAGSGSLTARGTLKRLHRADASEQDGVALGVEALFDAAEEDSATGGPDLVRRIYPIVAVIDRDGYRELGDDAVSEHVEHIVSTRGPREHAAD